MIALVDGNNFFVSCERVFHPEWEGRAVAVLSNNDGCCVSRSNECKALGIPMGTPAFQLRNRPELLLVSSNYELYGDLSRRMIATLETFVPRVEQYSIDEAYLFPQLPDDADWFSFGCRVRQRVLQWVGIPCGIGFAPTKTLAKIANHIGKRQRSGVFVMPKDRSDILRELPVEEVWGIGRNLNRKLREQGIRTAGQLAALDPISVRRRYGLTVARTVLELQGISCIEEMPGEEETRSITCSRSFGHPVCQEAELVESIACHTAQAAVKLRKLGLTAAGANLFLQAYPDPGKEYWEGESFSSTVAFSRATDDTGHMLQALRPHVHALWRPGKRYRKSGVLFWGLEKGGNRQPDFFKQEPEQESSRLFQAVDALNRRFGKNAVFPLSMGIQRVWQAKREHVTPGYTTRWDQLLTVK